MSDPPPTRLELRTPKTLADGSGVIAGVSAPGDAPVTIHGCTVYEVDGAWARAWFRITDRNERAFNTVLEMTGDVGAQLGEWCDRHERVAGRFRPNSAEAAVRILQDGVGAVRARLARDAPALAVGDRVAASIEPRDLKIQNGVARLNFRLVAADPEPADEDPEGQQWESCSDECSETAGQGGNGEGSDGDGSDGDGNGDGDGDGDGSDGDSSEGEIADGDDPLAIPPPPEPATAAAEGARGDDDRRVKMLREAMNDMLDRFSASLAN